MLQIHTTSQSSSTQAYRQGIEDLDEELQYLKRAFEEEKIRYEEKPETGLLGGVTGLWLQNENVGSLPSLSCMMENSLKYNELNI